MTLPPIRIHFTVATVGFVGRPRTCQRMINHCDHVVHNVRIGFVEIKAFFEDRLIIEGERQSSCVEGARSLEWAARLDFEHVEGTGAALVDPMSNRKTSVARLNVSGPGALVGEDATV